MWYFYFFPDSKDCWSFLNTEIIFLNYDCFANIHYHVSYTTVKKLLLIPVHLLCAPPRAILTNLPPHGTD